MARKAETMYFRRSSKAARMRSSSSCGPSSATMAAAWLTAAAFVVDCPCKVPMAAITSRGAMPKPMRQPVMAYDFETPSTMTVRRRTSGPKVAGSTKRAPP